MLNNIFVNVLEQKKTEMAYGREKLIINFTV
jgi:hypothetical protein